MSARSTSLVGPLGQVSRLMDSGVCRGPQRCVHLPRPLRGPVASRKQLSIHGGGTAPDFHRLPFYARAGTRGAGLSGMGSVVRFRARRQGGRSESSDSRLLTSSRARLRPPNFPPLDSRLSTSVSRSRHPTLVTVSRGRLSRAGASPLSVPSVPSPSCPSLPPDRSRPHAAPVVSGDRAVVSLSRPEDSPCLCATPSDWYARLVAFSRAFRHWLESIEKAA